MNVADEIRKIEGELRNLSRRLARVRSGADLPAHHTSHESGGSDSIKLDDLAMPDDNADLDSTIIEHGLLKKLDNDPANYMDGQGNWTIPAGGGDINDGCLFGVMRTGHYYVGNEATPHILSTTGVVVDRLYAVPFLCPASQNFDRIAAYVTLAMGVGEWIHLGIYEDSGTCSPGDLVVDSGAIQRLVGAGPVEAVINETIGPGLYWLAFLANTVKNWLALSYLYIFPILGRDAVKQGAGDTIWYVAQAYGNLPDPFPGGAAYYDNEPIAVFLRKS